MFRRLFYWRISTESTDRIYEHIGSQCATTFLTLIAISIVIAANRTGAFDVSICQKCRSSHIIILFRFLYLQISIVIQYRKELLRSFMMQFSRSSMIEVESNPEVFEILLDNRMVFINDCLCSCSFLHRLYWNGSAMFVASANKNNIPFLSLEVTYINIRRKICPCKVTYVFQSICIRQSRSNQIPANCLIFILCVNIIIVHNSLS